MSEQVTVFMNGKERKILNFLIASFKTEIRQLLEILDEAEMSLSDFMDDRDSFRLYLSRDFPLLSEDLGWEWLMQIYLPTQKEDDKTPCPRPRAWQVEEKMRFDKQTAMQSEKIAK